MAPDIVVDISRLLSRVLHATPTGVDRVEMAYARGLLERYPAHLGFAAVHPSGLYGRLALQDVLHFLDNTEQRWETAGRHDPWAARRFALNALNRLRPRRTPPSYSSIRRVYIQSSPHHLDRPDIVQTILRRESARFICLLHDLIPLDFPEYARPGGAAQHRVRIETMLRYADGIVANSHATLATLQPWLARSDRNPALAVAHLGTYDAPHHPSTPVVNAASPYFVCVGTIEPRKNHLLLLNLWRRMSEEHGAAHVPKLVLIGRRGWENEQIVDMLERCPALVGCVEEQGGLSDRATRALVAGARALLLPSFAEGYGMPVTEALDLGVPVICSDLPSLREAGGGIPLFLDPLDGPGWRSAIELYADPDSEARKAQTQRLASWIRPEWKAHMKIVEDLILAVTA